jgi:hypothetical protein
MIPTNQDYDARISYMSAVPMYHSMMQDPMNADLLNRVIYKDGYRPTHYSEDCQWYWNSKEVYMTYAFGDGLGAHVFDLMNSTDAETGMNYVTTDAETGQETDVIEQLGYQLPTMADAFAQMTGSGIITTNGRAASSPHSFVDGAAACPGVEATHPYHGAILRLVHDGLLSMYAGYPRPLIAPSREFMPDTFAYDARRGEVWVPMGDNFCHYAMHVPTLDYTTSEPVNMMCDVHIVDDDNTDYILNSDSGRGQIEYQNGRIITCGITVHNGLWRNNGVGGGVHHLPADGSAIPMHSMQDKFVQADICDVYADDLCAPGHCPYGPENA